MPRQFIVLVGAPDTQAMLAALHRAEAALAARGWDKAC